MNANLGSMQTFSRNKMSSKAAVILWVILALSNCASTVGSVSIEGAAYKDIVFEIRDYVPVERCADFLLNLEVSISIPLLSFSQRNQMLRSMNRAGK